MKCSSTRLGSEGSFSDCTIFQVINLKNSWVHFTTCFRSLSIWTVTLAVQSVLLHLAKYEQKVSICCFRLLSSVNPSDQSHLKPLKPIHYIGLTVLGYWLWAVPNIFLFFPSFFEFQPVEECNSRSALTFLIVFMKFGWFLLGLVFLLYKGSWDHTPVAFIYHPGLFSSRTYQNPGFSLCF